MRLVPLGKTLMQNACSVRSVERFWTTSIVLRERHLKRIMRCDVPYSNEPRMHLALGKDSPRERQVQAPDQGRVFALSRVGGLHHEYIRLAAENYR